jgi:plasmid stability protein
MPTLYVKDVPDELYEGLKERARLAGRSVAAETRKILEDTLAEQRSRAEAFGRLRRFQETLVRTAKAHVDVTQLIRDDRDR